MKTSKTAKPSDLKRNDIKRALRVSEKWSDEKFKAKTGYGASRTYSAVRKNGKLAPAKAIVALACKLKFDALPSESFSGGKGPGCAGTILANLGFRVTGINAKMPKAA